MNSKHKNVIMLVMLSIVVITFMFYDEIFPEQEKVTDASHQKFHISPEKEPVVKEGKIAMKREVEQQTRKIAFDKSKVADPNEFLERAIRKSSDKQEPGQTAAATNQEVEDETVSEKPDKPRVVYVQSNVSAAPIEDVPTKPGPRKRRRTGFNSQTQTGSSINASEKNKQDVAIKAVVHRDVKVRSTDLVKLRTTDACTIEGVKLPANTFIDAVADLNSGAEKLYLSVSQLQTPNGDLVTLSMQAYSLSGSQGLPVNLSENKEIGRDIATNALTNTTQFVRPNSAISRAAINRAGKQKVEDRSASLKAGTKLVLRND